MRWLLAVLCAVASAEDWQPLEVIATAYCGTCVVCNGARAAGITSTNVKVRDVPYNVASDPEALPYGTVVWIPLGIGYLDRQFPEDADRQFVVDDTGGALRRNTREKGIVHIDLRFIHHTNAKKFGRKRITIWVWK